MFFHVLKTFFIFLHNGFDFCETRYKIKTFCISLQLWYESYFISVQFVSFTICIYIYSCL